MKSSSLPTQNPSLLTMGYNWCVGLVMVVLVAGCHVRVIGSDAGAPLASEMSWGVDFGSESPFDSDFAHSRSIFYSKEIASEVDWSKGGTLRLTVKELDPVTGKRDWVYNVRMNTSYNIVAVAPGLGPHDFVLAGRSRGGDLVLEHFSLSPPEGGYFVANWPQLPTSIDVVGDLGLTAPADRPPITRPVRSEVFRGPFDGDSLRVFCDPDARFVAILATDTSKLALAPFDPDSTIAYLQVPNPASLTKMRSLGIYQSSLGPRNLIGHAINASRDVLFVSDFDNDGVMDSTEVIPRSLYLQLGYPGLWVQDFVDTDSAWSQFD